MYLRSSQFVFLMLLICSVQVRERSGWHLRQGSTTSRTAQSAAHGEASVVPSQQIGQLCLRLERLSPRLSLNSADVTAQRTAWAMSSPARESAAIVSHTSFLRA